MSHKIVTCFYLNPKNFLMTQAMTSSLTYIRQLSQATPYPPPPNPKKRLILISTVTLLFFLRGSPGGVWWHHEPWWGWMTRSSGGSASAGRVGGLETGRSRVRSPAPPSWVVRCPWPGHLNPNCSWRAGSRLAWVTRQSVYECVNER